MLLDSNSVYSMELQVNASEYIGELLTAKTET